MWRLFVAAMCALSADALTTNSSTATSTTSSTTFVTNTSSSTFTSTSSSSSSSRTWTTSTSITTTTSSTFTTTSGNFTSGTETTTTGTNTSQTTTSTTSMSNTTTGTSTTTMTTTTNSTTTTSTTSTEIFLLTIEAAVLSPSELVVVFNYPARIAEPENTTWSCPDLWEEETAESFGIGATCLPSDDKLLLQVTLGQWPRVQVGHLAVMKFGVLLPDVIVFEPTELSAVITTTTPQVPLRGDLAAPDAVQPCSTVRFSLGASTGFAGRTPVIEWQLGNGTDPALAAILQPTLDEATSQVKQVLEIPPDIFYEAVSASTPQDDVSNETEKEVDLDVVVVSTISNWLGQSEELSAVVNVLNVDTQLPQIMPATRKEVDVFSYEELEIAVDFAPAVSISRCIVNATDDPSGEIDIQWEYRRIDDRACDAPDVIENISDTNGSNSSNDSNETNETWDNSSNSSNSSNASWLVPVSPCLAQLWRGFNRTGLVDKSPRPGKLHFGAFSFQPETRHQFRASAGLQGYVGEKPTVVFTVNVLPRTRPTAVISGPTRVSAVCGFNLSAADSYDASARVQPSTELEYFWSCVEGDFFENATDMGMSCDNMTEDWSDSPELHLESGFLAEGSHTFTLQVRRRGEEAVSEAMHVVHVSSHPQPLVVLKVPWTFGGPVSVARHSGLVRALVSDSCLIPNWNWQWVLTRNDVVLALLNTSVLEQPLSAGQEVVTSEFRGDLLVPGWSYEYALVGLSNDTAKRFAPGWYLAALEAMSGSAVAATSVPFLADGVPSEGILELAPRSGPALGRFSMQTYGWHDEEEASLSYSFVRFPADTGDAWADDTWVAPKMDWKNSSSERYFRKLGGLTLQHWDSSSVLADVVMAPGTFFIVVRVRDRLGGEASAAVLGPVVASEDVALQEVADALEASFTSRDADRILNTVDAVLLSSRGSALFTEPLLGALEVALGIMEPSADGLEKMGQVVASLVGGSGGARSGAPQVVNKSQLSRAADLLQSCVGLAAVQPAGLSDAVAVSVLEALSGVNDGNRLGDNTTGDTSEAVNFTGRVEALADVVAQGLLSRLHLGESLSLSGVFEGSGLSLQVSWRNPLTVPATGFDYGDLLLPASLFQNEFGRRLQDMTCTSLVAKATYWHRSNPYTWADPMKGVNQYVFANGTVADMELSLCGSPFFFNETEPERAMRVRTVWLPPQPPPPPGFRMEVACARWSVADQAWLMTGVEVERPVYWDAVDVTCIAYVGAAAYTALYIPVEVTTSTTTEQWTHPTYTTFEVPPLPPVYIVSCNESLLPPDPGQGWNCTKPGEGQECRSACKGYPDMMTSMTCLKGSDSLEWFVTNICPDFFTTTLDVTVKVPSEDVVLGMVLIFLWILMFTCSAAILALFAYGVYKFVMYERPKPTSRARIAPLEQAEEDQVDPAFVAWARSWAASPAVSSAVLEAKAEKSLASASQESLTDINGRHSQAAATKVSAFTETVVLEYSDDWREEVDKMLKSREIPREGEGRLYYVVNTVREILQTKDIETLHRVNFPLTINLQESPPRVLEKSEAFYAWQVEWIALTAGQEPAQKAEAEIIAAPEEEETGMDHLLDEGQKQHDDLMQKWKQHGDQKLRKVADQPEGDQIAELDEVGNVFDRASSGGLVRSRQTYGGALADTAAQASSYVPELQQSFYEASTYADWQQSSYAEDTGWLEVRSPSGRLYYWNQFTQEEWEPGLDDTLQPE
ncbi:unnamed protein product [Effrenium voratum]|uniref:PKD/REJ-like domain-containing protein n=1 Tax=Effrenium voratum TaxID=2562239 RepID=A0AA36IF54_9DINO|nr:unnamed protein product [Effrenium voratum]